MALMKAFETLGRVFRGREERGLARPILVAVHHKVGTVWMQNTFRAIAAEFGHRFRNSRRDPAVTDADIYFEDHGRVPDPLRQRDFRGLHLVRDPRDIVLSGLRYHLDSTEKWLLQPRDDLGGRTYQEALNALPADARYEFELRGTAAGTFAELAGWNYDDPRFYEARYETLIADRDAVEFREILAFLGFPKRQIEPACRIFRKNSLFSRPQAAKPAGHVRDGRPRQWETQMTRAEGECFVAHAGELLIRLGYERNHDWVLRLPD